MGISGSGVGALRKHAGGMFLASDLGGYAAVAATSPYTGEALGVRFVGRGALTPPHDVIPRQ